MLGTKAEALAAWTEDHKHPYVRFDYFGHGESSGEFLDGTIGRWLDDTLTIMDEVATGPQILVGSSMGGWLALLAALKRPGRVKGLVLIAPATDFTEVLTWSGLDENTQAKVKQEGVYYEPSDYAEEGMPFSYQLIEEGRSHLLLPGPIAIDLPIRILHGLMDDTVPVDHVMAQVNALTSSDLSVTFIKSGDHRLSEPSNLEQLKETLQSLYRIIAEG